MKKVLVLGMILGIVAFVLFLRPFSGDSKKSQEDQLIEENRELKKDLENAREQLSPLEVENETLRQYLDEEVQAKYIEATFPQDGNFYRSDEDFEFYKDPQCTEKIEGRPTIISPEVDEKTPDGEEAYCICLSTEGLIFSKSWPELYISN